jgi:hypothetical protein
MNYTQTKKLFDALDSLETFCNLRTKELSAEHCSFGQVAYCSERIQKARQVIFDLLERSQ